MKYFDSKSLFRPLTLLGATLVIVVSLFGFSVLTQTAQAASSKPALGKRLLMIHDGSTQQGILTAATTVRDALTSANVPLDPHDVTEPSLDEPLADSQYDVNIYRARPVAIIDGATRIRVITAARTPQLIARDAGIVLRDEDHTDFSRGEYGVAEQMTIQRATAFTFVFYGNTQTAYTRERTVGDMLKAKKITMTRDDGTSVPLSTPITAGMTVKLWRNGIQAVTVDEEVAFPVEKIMDADQPVGYRHVKTPGVKGRRTVTYEINTQNGAEVSRKEINSTTTQQPTKEVVVVGAKNNYSGSLNEWLTALRGCETGGNYSRNSGNGYYGAYQFLPSTWNSIARKTGRSDLVGVMPHLAAPADQDAMVIANTNMTAGLSTQHPGCYAKLGLSNKPPQ